MRRNFFTMAAALMLVAGSIHAQDVAIGVKGGLNIPKITKGSDDNTTPLSEGYSSRLAANGGLFAEVRFSRLFSLTMGVEYSGQGGEKNGLQAVPTDQVFSNMKAALGSQYEQMIALTQSFVPDEYLYADFNSTAKFNYIMVPVQAKFGWNLSKRSPVRFYVSAGLFGSYLVSAERVQTGTSAFYYDYNGVNMTMPTYWNNLPGVPYQGSLQQQKDQLVLTNPQAAAGVGLLFNGMNTATPGNMDRTQGITKDLYRWNFGFIGAAGAEYTWLRNSIFVEAGGNYGFLKMQRNEKNGQNRIGAGSISAGYSRWIGKKNFK